TDTRERPRPNRGLCHGPTLKGMLCNKAGVEMLRRAALSRPTLSWAAAIVLASQLAGCMVPSGWGSPPKIAPGTPGGQVNDPAKAVLLRYLPSRADDQAFLALIDKALRSSRGQRIVDEGRSSIGELAAIRDEVAIRGLPPVFVGIPMWESYLDT